jgi:hypothetical protein
MNRRAFLKLFVGTVAVATLPIPKFLLKEEKPVDTFSAYGQWRSTMIESGGVLTQKMIEDAAERAAMNCGRPDVMYMSKKNYKTFAKVFGYQVVYSDDEIFHVKC